MPKVFQLSASAFSFPALPFLTGNWVKSDQNVKSKGIEIAVAIAAAIEHFDFQVDSFGKAIVEATIKVIQDLLPPISQGIDKRLSALKEAASTWSAQ